MNKAIVRLSACCLAASMLLAGCSSKDEETEKTSSETTTTEATVSVAATTETTENFTTEATTKLPTEATSEETAETTDAEPKTNTVYSGLTFNELQPVSVDEALFQEAYAVVDSSAKIYEAEIPPLRKDDHATKLINAENPRSYISGSYMEFETPDDAYCDFMSWNLAGKKDDSICFYDEASSFGYLIQSGEVILVCNGVRVYIQYSPLEKYAAPVNDFFIAIGAYVEMTGEN